MTCFVVIDPHCKEMYPLYYGLIGALDVHPAHEPELVLQTGASKMSDDTTPGSEGDLQHRSAENERRRDFLKTLGKAALITPPAMTVLLSTSLDSEAIAASGGKSPWGKANKRRGFLSKIFGRHAKKKGYLKRHFGRK